MVASRSRPLRRLILVFDALIVTGALALAGGLHAAMRSTFDIFKTPPRFEEYALIVYLSVPLWLGLIALFGLHRTFERTWTRARLVFDLVKLHVAGLIGLSVALFFTQSIINRSLVGLFLGCSFILFYCVRGALAFWQRYQYAVGQGRIRLLVIGDQTPALADFLLATRAQPLSPEFAGHLGSGEVDGLTHLGTLEDLPGVLHDQAVDHVLFFPPYNHPMDVAPALTSCETVGVSAEFAVELVQPTQARPRVLDLYGRPFLSFDPAPKSAEQLAIKHAFDWVGSAAGLLVLAPLLLGVSLAIALTMGRPIFFAQKRAGRYGREFRMIKFRTMVHDAEAKQLTLAAQNEMTGPVFKIARDPRVTRLGAFLRRTSIDELPQLFNVLLGSMSLVGPRPLPINEQQQIHGWHRRRLSMKPGITGLWQVSGRNDIDFDEWMRLDRRYVDEWSLGLDLALLMKTIPAVLFRRGAR